MPHATQYGRTLLLDSLHGDSGVPLERIQFVKGSVEEDRYNEVWIQRLIMAKPGVLPIEQIEPALTGLVPICTELTLPSGSLDNLFITPAGGLVLVECKLWRNAESRRKILGQIMDYAHELSHWSYEELESAVQRTAAFRKQGVDRKTSLFDLVSTFGVEHAESQVESKEAEFVDAVSKNLRQGCFLLLMVGDGIREDVERLTGFLQQHAGLHFTFGLVELAFFKMPTEGFLVQPRVLARTTNIIRGIVTFEDDRIKVTADATTGAAVGPPSTQLTITKEQYFKQLEQTLPGITSKLNKFTDKLEDAGVHAEFGAKTLILRWYPESGHVWNFGTIAIGGEIWMDYLTSRAKEEGLTSLAAQYMEQIARSVPGATVKYKNASQIPSVIHLDGKTIKLDTLLAEDSRVDAWLQAIAELQEGISAKLMSQP